MLEKKIKKDEKQFIFDLNDYIEKNIIFDDEFEKSINQILMIINYISDKDVQSEPTLFIKLVKKNQILSQILNNIVSNYRENIKKVEYEYLQQNDLFMSFIDAYCYINNLEIESLTSEELINNDDNLYFESCSKDIVSDYYQQLRRIPLLSVEEERALLIKKENNDIDAKKELVERNLRLVVNIAKRYANQGIPLIDLIQEGNLGLMTAVDRFDITKENRFSTYAVWWIRQAITRYISTKRKLISIPVGLTDLINKYNKSIKTLQNELGYKPSIKQIADYMNKSESEIKKIEKAQFDVVSLNSPVDEEHETELGDLIAGEESFEENIFDKELHGLIMKMINQIDFTPNERIAIQLRYGINCDYPMTLDEIAKKIGITRERVRQIEAKALRKIRNSSYLKLLAGYHDSSKKVENNSYSYCYSKNGF